MRTSDNRSTGTSRSRPRPRPNLVQNLVGMFVQYVLLFDLFFCIFAIIAYTCILGENPILTTGRSDLTDILNELISASLSSGGFILAALAIVASLQSIVPVKDVSKAQTGEEYLYNGKGYRMIMMVFIKACVIYLFVFLGFTYARSVSSSIDITYLSYIIIIGVVLMSTNFIRAIYILANLLTLRNSQSKK